jgi:hypothetical protein
VKSWKLRSCLKLGLITAERSDVVRPENNLKQEGTFYVPWDRSKITTSKTRGQFEARGNINFSAIKQNINWRKPINETVGDTKRALNNKAKKN